VKFVEITVLIVTDGAESTRKTAEAIAGELKKCKVISVSAKDFAGTDLLPADCCFFGAENPDPPSYSYLYKMLQHINLAGRSCGIFSRSKKAAEYLCAMVKASEAALYPDPYLGEGDIKEWVKKVVELLK
jgi:hypothetical protein